MSKLRASVVIVSRDRPALLNKCLKALEFQTFRNFEVIVVANSRSRSGLRTDRAKIVPFETANISAARNIGIDHAAGEVVAFIDDDAIAEPTWLSALLEPFSNRAVSSAGGFVVGRNGFSLQWAGELLNYAAEAEPLTTTKTVIVEGGGEKFLKTQGTNCAFRRQTLVKNGGFDENFHYFLDETELNIRLGHLNDQAALVPAALVQHGYASNMVRRGDRAPKSLFEIGASYSYFIKKHGLETERLDLVRQEQRNRLLRAMVSGLIGPEDIKPMLRTLEKGIRAGGKRLTSERVFPKAPSNFCKYCKDDLYTGSTFLFARRRNLRGQRRKAQREVAAGKATTLFSFRLTSWRHRRSFHADGYWQQVGGLFGKSSRSDPFFKFYRYKTRFFRERDELLITRPLV